MGTTRYTILVTLPDGKPASGASITGTNTNAWSSGAKSWSGTTMQDGTHTWENIDTGLNGNKYDFYCRYLDSNGLEWVGEASDRIFSVPSGIIKQITLRHKFLDEDIDFTLRADLEGEIAKNEDGHEILTAIKEMGLAIKQGMSHSAMALSTYIIEGLIITKAKKESLWRDEWNKYTYGMLIEEAAIKPLIPTQIYDRLKALNHLRVIGVHFKGVGSFIEDAKSGAAAIIYLAEAWFKPLPLRGESTDVVKPDESHE